MKRTVLNVQQGTPEWLAARAASDGTASEAATAAGKGKYQKRNDLLAQRKTGITPDVSASTQALFDRGHATEAAARPMAESIIEDELSPTTITLEVEGLTLLASLDGITFDDETIFEHKLWSEKLAAQVRAGELEEHYTIQMDQELLVSGAKRCLFMCSDGTEANCVWMWYESSEEKARKVIDTWHQFKKDLAEFVPTAAPEQVKAEVVIELPALFVQAKGEITTSNMKEFGLALADRLKTVRAIELVTDQDFANAKQYAAMFRDQIKKLEAAQESMLSQTASIGEAKRLMDAWAEDLRVTALKLEKDVKREDKAKKEAMILKARQAFIDYVATLEKETDGIRVSQQLPDFAGFIKGKRNYASMQDAIDTALANGKASADAAARDIRTKLAWYRGAAAGHEIIFADLSTIITKPEDDFKLVVKTRLDQHKQDEEKRLEDIRQQEAAKLAAEAMKPAEQETSVEVNAKIEPEPVAQVSPKTVSVNPQYFSGARPTKAELVAVVAKAYSANQDLAEVWLNAAFGPMAKAA
ncbi:putative phage-related endonuclease [Methylovorus glucosotrophus]|uniref:YqaJ viral recombinase family protein n=1 Tax=Methylovorus glucosotrophus TaxID=266009 RepID=UPI001331928D|nr:YqaJ viral recombinase family protein [Methylovorus glucosotrophus]KAF0844363.1 putative phage-related endonuclease [Methylovorus glucosotrophus]